MAPTAPCAFMVVSLRVAVAVWGFFNVVEGLIDHQLLGVHHARHDLGAPLSWDIGFLVFGVILIGAGWVLYRRGSRKLAASAR